MKAAMGKAPAGDRIIGGSNAAGVVPWQVSLRNVHSGLDADLKPFEMSTHYCGGTILDEKTILSAAHCFPRVMKALRENKSWQVLSTSKTPQQVKEFPWKKSSRTQSFHGLQNT